MATISLTGLTIILILLIFVSGFFSASETSMMSINRYRLRHLARIKKHRAARRSKKLLERPDRLLGVILIGNTFANIVASAIATIIANRLYGDVGVAIATVVLTLLILIFSEMCPKTIAALNPERVAFAFSFTLMITLKLLYPIVWFANVIVNNLLFVLGVKVRKSQIDQLSQEELRTVVDEAGKKIPSKHQTMLLGILDLEKATVEDIMIPRQEIVGIDLNDHWDDILDQLLISQHTRLPIFRDDIDNVIGMLHARKMLSLMSHDALSKESIEKAMEPIYFIPESTPLNIQLIHFQRQNRRSGLIVDEYGDIVGLVTLEDILEEIVGEFTTDYANNHQEIHPQSDGSTLVDGGVNIRKLNRVMNWHLPLDGPKTLSGLVIEILEFIPRAGTCLKIDSYPIEIVQVKDNMIKTLRFIHYPQTN